MREVNSDTNKGGRPSGHGKNPVGPGAARGSTPNVNPEQPVKPNRGAPDISTSDIMMVQETLQVKGLYRGEIDGIPGSQTLRAVRAYKKQNNIPVSNRLTADFVSHLRSAF